MRMRWPCWQHGQTRLSARGVWSPGRSVASPVISGGGACKSELSGLPTPVDPEQLFQSIPSSRYD